MDSLTQATLGAAVAHTCWHRQLGRTALLWGLALGTLPDTDVILYPVLNDIQRLYWHRGESHSVFFLVLGSLLIGWLLWKSRWKEVLSPRRAITGIFLIFVTHVTVDYFNVYGTQLLAPISRHGFGHGNMFIIDPLFTLPLLIGIIMAGIFKGHTGNRANLTGVILSSIYALFSLVSHAYADHTFKQQLRTRNIEVLRSMTGATPMNTLLWRHVARTPEGLLIGYFSIIGDNPHDKIHFDLIPRNENLIESYKGQANVKTVEWFSQGFWVAWEKNGILNMSDLRFGEFRFNETDPPENWQYIFTWKITPDPYVLSLEPMSVKNGKEALRSLWRRLSGTENVVISSQN